MCLFVFFFPPLPLPDGAGEHRGDTGHVFGDGGHLPVSSHGHGGRVGVCQLPQLQRDRGGEEHVVRGADEAMSPPGCVLKVFKLFIVELDSHVVSQP